MDQIVAQLEQAILTGELAQGQKLSEQALSDRFGVSRGPLREAIRTLEGRHLVERTPFSGVRVVQLSLDDMEQLLTTREALEGMASRQAAENMTLHETRRLRACLSAFEDSFRREGIGGVFRAGTVHNDLHMLIVRGSRNRWLTDIICNELYPLLRICRFQSTVVTARTKRRVEAVHREHEAIIVAIERRDADAAESAMRAHLIASRSNLMTELRGKAGATAVAEG
ncbi:GntR family transcriptional regulator [Bradyrhizobium genomosp. I (2014)]|uniref:GntR family transcriptional regulator n=1 Tax=Bradyrhizobium genomosp. I (2014) TaxID=2683269 RepID=UPI0004B228CC|nr:GntR family transcriptional regulator [Bradyrhizobium sp. CCBAU 43298]